MGGGVDGCHCRESLGGGGERKRKIDGERTNDQKRDHSILRKREKKRG